MSEVITICPSFSTCTDKWYVYLSSNVPITLNMHCYHLCIKYTKLHRTVDGRYRGLKDYGGGGGKHCFVRRSIKQHALPSKHCPSAKTQHWCPQGSSSFQRKHRKIKQAGWNISTPCRTGSETYWGHLSTPTSLLTAFLQWHILIPMPSSTCPIVHRCA